MQVPIVEQLKEMNGWKGHANGPNNAFITVFQETFFNAIFGWCLGTGYYARGSYFEALTSTCGFEPKECYFVVFEPHGLHDHTCAHPDPDHNPTPTQP